MEIRKQSTLCNTLMNLSFGEKNSHYIMPAIAIMLHYLVVQEAY